jgi:HEAT repeat protein
MALFSTGKPNVKGLARRGDADALVAACGFQDLVPAPGGGTRDRGAQVRQEAVLALGALGPEFGTDAVRAALLDPADTVRVAAIRVLRVREDATTLAAGLPWLPADDTHSRPHAIRALLDLGEPGSAASLSDALVRLPGQAPAGDDEAAVLKALLDADDGAEAASEVVEQLLVALSDEREEVADRAEELLALLEPVSTEDVIAELTAGAAPHRAAAVLARIKATRALEPLMEGLIHRDARVRAACAQALGELRDPAAVEPLIHASRDPDHRVRAQAGWALDRLGMIALIVGVSTMIRPVIEKAMSAPEMRPVLTGAEDGALSTGGLGGEHTPGRAGLISADVLERLLAGTEHGRE